MRKTLIRIELWYFRAKSRLKRLVQRRADQPSLNSFTRGIYRGDLEDCNCEGTAGEIYVHRLEPDSAIAPSLSPPQNQTTQTL